MVFKRADEYRWNKLEDLAKVEREEIESSLVEFMKWAKDAPAARQMFKPSLDRVERVKKKLHDEFTGRDESIDAVLASFISGVPTVLLGPPGTAKSAIVRRIAEYCDLRSSHDGGTYFEYLLTDHTMPEELFGAPDLAELQKGNLLRVVKGKLPTAEIAFLDEVFRGGSHILNTLLSVVNERLFHDGTQVRHVPLLAVVAASNRPPAHEDTTAFYDRFPARVWVDSVFKDPLKQAETVAANLLEQSLAQDERRLRNAWSEEAKAAERKASRVACVTDFRAARVVCTFESRVASGSRRLEEFKNLFVDLRERCCLSDRSFGALWRLGTALDLVANREPREPVREGGDGHVRVFRFAAHDATQVRHVNDTVENALRGWGHTGDD
jgi:MoxR-like ATPase